MHPLLDCKMPRTLQEWILPKIEVSYFCNEKQGCETRILLETATYVYGNCVVLSLTYLDSGNNVICIAGWELMDVAQGLARTKC